MNRSRISQTLIAVPLTGCLIALSGCVVLAVPVAAVGEYDRDVSHRSERWSGYSRDQVYEIAVDLFIVEEKGNSKGPALTIGTEEDLFETPGHRFWYWGPTTAKQYKANPEYYPDAFGVVDAGTRIRVHALREFGNAAFSDQSSYVRAEILDGSYAGLIVELSQVSLYSKSDDERPVLVRPDSVFLRLVSPDPKSPGSPR